MTDSAHAPGPFRPSDLGGRIPIVVGVTGHRDLFEEDAPYVEAAFQERLRALLARYPHTPIVVMSALAEGADQWAARATLRLADELSTSAAFAGRLFVVAPLPMPEDAYLARFFPDDPAAADAARRAFRTLSARALTYVLTDQDCHTPPAPDASVDERTEPYRQFAAYVVRNSHLLAAFATPRTLAASRDAQGKDDGGTAMVLRWFEQGPPRGGPVDYNPGAGPLDHPDPLLPLIEIPVRRRSEGGDRPEIPAWDLAAEIARQDAASKGDVASPTARSGFHRVFRGFDAFNRDALRARSERKAEVDAAVVRLLPLPRGSALPAELTAAAATYAAADVLAKAELKPATERHGRLLLGLTAISVVAFECFAHIRPMGAFGLHDTPMFVVYVAAAVAAFALHRRFAASAVEPRAVVYRALAEGLRLQGAWKYGAVRAIVSNHYLRCHRSEIDWVRHAIHGLYVCMPPLAAAARTDVRVAERRRLLKEAWIDGQADYFKDRRASFVHALHRLHLLWSACVRLGFFFAAAVLASDLLLGRLAGFLAEREAATGALHAVQHVLLSCVVLSFVAAGLFHEHGRVKAFAALARRYAYQEEVFRRASERLSAPGVAAEQVHDLLKTVGSEALAENLSWVLLRRDTPLEIHPH